MKARRLLAPAVVAALAASAPGGATDVTRIAPGDTVLGDVLAPGEIDVYDFDAPAGSVVTLDVRNVPPAGWRPSLGVATAGYERFLGLAGVAPTKAQTELLTASGAHRLVVGSSEGTTGGYKIRLTVAPGRTFAASGTGASPTGSLQFGAPEGAEVTVELRWRGPAPVTLAALVGPEGELTSDDAPTTKRTSSRQGGFLTTALGDHTLTVDVPAGTQSWTATARVKSPRPPRGAVHDLRADGTPPARTVEILNVADTPAVRVLGERGGPNDLLLRSTGFHVNGVVLDSRNGGCGAVAFEPEGAPASYRFRCTAGFSADIRGVVREGDLVRSFDAVLVRSPNGSGSVAFEGIEYDAQDRPVAWTEIRSFDASGNVHILEVRDVARRPADAVIVGYTVTHRLRRGDGDLLLGVHDYAPLRTR